MLERLDPKQCAVVIIDVQERLAAAMPPPRVADLTRAATVLLDAAQVLGARAIATEQYPAGLGRTLPPIAERLGPRGITVIEKIDFSACDAPEFEQAWAEGPKATAIVLGMETHVCVFQTVRALIARGISVHVPIDGVASRRDDHREVGIALCRAAGGVITTMETVVFDWLRRAGTNEFKGLSKLIR
jgi:nicotinamidase-related amidase